MKAKLAFGVGLDVGYVVGTRVGRGGYESLKSQARSLWKSEPVQETSNALEDPIKSEAKEMSSKLVEKVSGNATGGQDRTSVPAELKRTPPPPMSNPTRL